MISCLCFRSILLLAGIYVLVPNGGQVEASEGEGGGGCKALGHCLKKCLAGGGGMRMKGESGFVIVL